MVKLVEQYGVPTIYVDDFSDHQIINGQLRCVGYRLQDESGERLGIIEVRLIINLAGLPGAIARTQEVMEKGDMGIDAVTEGARVH